MDTKYKILTTQIQSTPSGTPSEGNLVSVKPKVRWGMREKKKMFCLSTSGIVCNYANVKFVKWPHEPAANRKFSCSQLENGFFLIFLYRNVALYYVGHDFGRSVRYSETKKQGKCRAGGHESVRISVIARVRNDGSLFQSFLDAFRRGAGFCPLWQSVRNSKVSARRHPTVFRNLKETQRSSYRENMLAWRIE